MDSDSLRVLAKPSRFGGNETEWIGWEFVFKNYMSLAAPEVAMFMDACEEREPA